MSALLGLAALLGALGVWVGARHAWLRIGDRQGFEAALRLRDGRPVSGITRRWRQGYVQRELAGLVWRRILWPGTPVRFTRTAVGFGDARPAGPADRALWIPPVWVVVPVAIDGGRAELAAHRRKVERLLAGRDPDPR